MKIFLIGASGSIGWPLFKFLKKKYKVVGTYNNKKKRGLLKFSLGKKKYENKLISQVSQNDIVMLLLAETNVAWVHDNPRKSFNVNYNLTTELIKKLIKKKTRIIYFSSAEVFNGKKGYYKESSKPIPVNTYGKTKYSVEKFLKKTNYKNYQIIRTGRNVNMSDDYRCMIKDTYERLLRNNAKMAKDNLFTITHMNDFNKAIHKLIKSKSQQIIYHICSDEVLSRVKFASLIKKNSKKKNKMNYRIVKFKDVGYKEPRACKNNLTCDVTKKTLKISFINADKIIKEKVRILDSIADVR